MIDKIKTMNGSSIVKINTIKNISYTLILQRFLVVPETPLFEDINILRTADKQNSVLAIDEFCIIKILIMVFLIKIYILTVQKPDQTWNIQLNIMGW